MEVDEAQLEVPHNEAVTSLKTMVGAIGWTSKHGYQPDPDVNKTRGWNSEY
jgi:hypothetical protein